MANINAVDLNLLKALDALIETRSVTRAAERLELSQPAVSGMLARLREVFGDPGNPVTVRLPEAAACRHAVRAPVTGSSPVRGPADLG